MAYVYMKSSAQKEPRNPKCARCRNHGFVVPLKGHSGKCQFFSCQCWKCSLITERTKIMATQRRLKKSYREEIAKNRGSAVLAPQANATSAQEREASVVEHMPDAFGSGPGKEVTVSLGPGDACMPAGGAEADGKTYMEFEVVPGAAAEDHLSMPSTGETVVEEPVERRSAGPPHYGIREETPMDRSSGGQMQPEMMHHVYSMGERMGFPLVYSYPGGYACPAILVNLQPPQVPFKDPFFPHPQPGGFVYTADHISPQGGCMPLFPPYAMPCPGFREEAPLRRHLYPAQQQQGREFRRAEFDSDKLQGSQGTDVLPVDGSSQETV
ncbi:doublesex- and mab-3-related transcription factor B1-like [Engraulis encrasicolus]|uniref:doublesex- and mab-3-related transcription factor B1-like n=1 Tax=Engraulis encrasicolus TaxID=184585 RepID=UPI002FD0ACD0